MISFDLDPNAVKPGWTALIVLVILGIALVFLFLSMRKQFRKINAGSLPSARDLAPEAPASDDRPDASAEEAPKASPGSPR